ncbi:MAG: GAF domain-containing protein [Thermoleophilia bacterium]
MSSLLQVARSLLSDMDLEAVLARVLQAARDLTGARYAALGVLDESRSALERFITAGVDDAMIEQIGALPTGRGVLGELVQHPAPLRLADVGAHPHSYGFPAGHPPMTTFLGVPVFVADQLYGNLYLTDKRDHDEFDAEDEHALVLLAQFAGLAIDHARRFTGSEVRREELQRTVQALDASTQIVRAVGGETDLDTILQLVAKRGRALVSARTLVIEQRRGDQLVIAAAAGELPAGIIGQSIALRDSVASTVLRTTLTQRLEDEPNNLRFERHGLGQLGFSARAGLVVPLVFRGEAHGVLVAIDRLTDGPGFSNDDQHLLESFATSAATAIATANTAATDRRRQSVAATEHERDRWARELHDDTLQNLAALRLTLASAHRDTNPDALAAALPAAIEQLETDIASLRSLITELRPAALSQLGPHAAIDALAQRARLNGMQVDVRVQLAYDQGRASSRLLAELETAAYRITQEALTNAHKHANARHATVQISEDDSTLTVSVQDDGDGFDPARPADGFGLLGMRERAELLDGTLTIISSPGDGTTVTAMLPAHHRPDEPQHEHDRHAPGAPLSPPDTRSQADTRAREASQR